MGRRKIEIRAIKDDRNRSVTFLKRKGGLFKKAHELSVLCSVNVAVIIFGHNKKLYEFSSGDINETLRRYQYYGPPHEHKGPSDFKNKGGDGSDDEEDDGDDGSQKREDSLPPQQHLMPPHMQHSHHNSFQHVRQPAASASPPMPNGFQPRHSTPQPPNMISRSNSRNEIRRSTSSIVPMQPGQHPQQPPPNGYAYISNPPLYNPNAAIQAAVPPPQRSPQPQFQQFQHVQQHPQPQPHQQIQHAHQQYLQAQRQQNQPPPPPPPPSLNSLQPPPQPAPRSSPQPDQHTLRPPSPPDRRGSSSKSQSIFTPIDEGGSVLAKLFFGAPDPPKQIERKPSPPEIKPPPRAISQPSNLNRPPTSQPPRTTTMTSASNEFVAPKRHDTGGSKGSGARPKLNLTIPSESEENESGSGSQGGAASEARSANPERNHNGLVLPPPSPSASALLSAGASGPPNPFARPPPPPSQQNSNVYSENRNNSNNIETPISALPSRYMDSSLMASPGGLFSDWDNWGRGGLNSAVLPSPLNFPTPADVKPPILFGKGDGSDDKRKADETAGGDQKRLKT